MAIKKGAPSKSKKGRLTLAQKTIAGRLVVRGRHLPLASYICSWSR